MHSDFNVKIDTTKLTAAFNNFANAPRNMRLMVKDRWEWGKVVLETNDHNRLGFENKRNCRNYFMFHMNIQHFI